MGTGFAKWVYQLLENMHKKPNKILYNNAVREDLQTLEPTADISGRQKEYVIKKLSVCSMIVVMGVVLFFVLWIKEEISAKIVDNCIERNQYGDGIKNVSLIADDGTKAYDVPVTIEERQYTQEELEELLKKAILVLEECILGENQSLDEIVYDVILVDKIAGYPFDIEWIVDEEYIDCEGRLIKSRLDSPKLVELTAVLSCGEFSAEHSMTLNIHSRAIQPDKAAFIAEKVHNIEEQNRQKQNIPLPSQIENQRIQWRYKKSYASLLFLAATPILALLVYYSCDRDLHTQVKNREEQMRMDYPEIVSALALLIGAGVTVPNAWIKIAKDYKSRKENKYINISKRYAYEEMLLTVYEMESGEAQTKAYEHFGRRCRIPDYNKLSTMLSQNIRKGAANLPFLLKEEARNAFENRKHTARKLGEKAGTKLLVPMMMLLGITLIIIMIPAFRMYL